MNDRNGQISRRDALRMALGVGAGLALHPRDLWAHEAGWDDLQAAHVPAELEEAPPPVPPVPVPV